MITEAISRYKRLRTERFLTQTWQGKYAFVGMGQHSLSNLYPVLDYLKLPLKYICVTTERKAALISRKFHGITGTASLETVLGDPEVAGVFVAAAPEAHFEIARQVLRSGKALFIEKPPCRNLQELEELAALAGNSSAATKEQPRRGQSTVVVTGLQKRYAPCTRMLLQRLRTDAPTHYDLHYRTGAYPEGDALLDLFIHPLDLACYLFGPAEVVASRRVGRTTLLMLEHGNGVAGTVELSTGGSWDGATETLEVATAHGLYRMEQMEELTFTPSPGAVLGIPLEKVRPRARVTETLFGRNNFNPVIANNQIVTAGYFGEIKAFAEAVEAGLSGKGPGARGNKILPCSAPAEILDTYRLIEKLRQ